MAQELTVNVTECGMNFRNVRIGLSYVQERVSIAGVRLLSYKGPAYEAGPWWTSGNLDLGSGPTFPPW